MEAEIAQHQISPAEEVIQGPMEHVAHLVFETKDGSLELRPSVSSMASLIRRCFPTVGPIGTGAPTFSGGTIPTKSVDSKQVASKTLLLATCNL